MDYSICVYAMMSELLVKGCSGKEKRGHHWCCLKDYFVSNVNKSLLMIIGVCYSSSLCIFLCLTRLSVSLFLSDAFRRLMTH